MCKYYKHDDYYTVQKKENLGDNDVENVFFITKKRIYSTNRTNYTHHREGIDEWITLMREDSTKHISSCPRKGHTS